jgi:hypothetical protein
MSPVQAVTGDRISLCDLPIFYIAWNKPSLKNTVIRSAISTDPMLRNATANIDSPVWKRLMIILLWMTVTPAWGQTTVTGTVISSDDGNPLPGVNILEKGSSTGTVTGSDGTFTLSVRDRQATLVATFIGYRSQEIPVSGRSQVDIRLKIDCIRDWFDVQQIGLSVLSGVVNNPVGGRLEISYPPVFRETTIKSDVSYQTDLDNHALCFARLSLLHLAVQCNFDADIHADFHRVIATRRFDARAYSAETSLNFRRLRVIGGFSNADVRPQEALKRGGSAGPILGLGTYISKPLYITVTGKVAIFKSLAEYQGDVQWEYKRFKAFARFYKLDTFTEVSMGVGIDVYYRFKKRQSY